MSTQIMGWTTHKLFFLFILVFIMSSSSDAKDVHNSGRTEKFNEACINAHNEYRKLAGAPDLSFDPLISQLAEDRLNDIIKYEQFNQKLRREGYGENMHWVHYKKSFKDVDCKRAVKSWYDEIKDWDFELNEAYPGIKDVNTKHFTQVVWKSSRDVGCAWAQSNYPLNGKDVKSTFIVCLYAPKGNIDNNYEFNVEPPEGHKPRELTEDEAKKRAEREQKEIEKMQETPKKGIQKRDEGPDFTNECVESHNEFRRDHSSPQLKKDSMLVSLASQTVDRLFDYSDFSDDVAPDCLGYSKAIIKSTGTGFVEPDCHALVTQWYHEKDYWDFDEDEPIGGFKNFPHVKHFTQMIWRDTLRIGCTWAQGGVSTENGTVFSITAQLCLYRRMGNIAGKFDENVLNHQTEPEDPKIMSESHVHQSKPKYQPNHYIDEWD